MLLLRPGAVLCGRDLNEMKMTAVYRELSSEEELKEEF